MCGHDVREHQLEERETLVCIKETAKRHKWKNSENEATLVSSINEVSCGFLPHPFESTIL